MKKRVYIETTFVSYLKARPSRDLIVAAHQQLTNEWWDQCRADYELCASQLVLQEAGAGDPEAARERLEVLAGMTLLAATPDAIDLAKEFLKAGALPTKAAEDSLHIAVATVHAAAYLLTWNCRHIANATMRPVIEAVCSKNGFTAPVICTPEQLMGPKK